MQSKLIPETKCAPSKKYKDGSCFSKESLQKLAIKYNERHDDKININATKKELVNTFEKKLSNVCSEQTCWLKLDIVKEIEDEDDKNEIENNTFRPTGPRKKYEWLSTTHINEVIEQYHDVDKNFVFLGAVPYDFEELPILGFKNMDFNKFINEGKNKIGMVINLDNHDQDGSHWVGLYSDLLKNQVYFFDSLGYPPRKRIRKFINRIVKFLYKRKYNEELKINDVIETLKNKNTNEKYIKNLLGGAMDVRYNNIQHQFDNSECGVYSINFIIRLVQNEPFDNIIHKITKDEAMNQNRKIYFRNVN
jgi:hypothetical protein